ncbi:sigma-70 family RNA polymerase sigma factor [Nocardia sp. alder85J]|uniref:sigma-70 family RNA polymerase sigma factor n=1 Tax=Nocardia sp. alder85J TaxID=2862949 RepID=UPI001CD2C0B4|nr:sigma-70 family RNA polymerase sigma factor [Nocardia sp. alder85J]MCX4091066.1 sigma-70 family RNA polymerase sigma factor [Nocardia sp. alder85J]
MDEDQWLADRFEAQRSHLRRVALRMLGSAADADDAVQEAWLRLSRSNVDEVRDLGRWLTTVVGRVCLDMLRSRATRAEQALDAPVESSAEFETSDSDPAQEVVLSESVGLALLVVLDILTPDERVAFVLHDVFAVPHAEIAPLIDRSVGATKMLVSRARRRVRNADTAAHPDTSRQHSLVQAFLTAAREGDFDALLELLDPDVVFRADAVARQAGAPADLDGAAVLARRFCGRARGARLALIDGAAGAAWAPGGVPLGVFMFTVTDTRIVAIELVGEPEHLARLALTVL